MVKLRMLRGLPTLVVGVKDLDSLQQQGFNPWPGNFHMLWVWPKKGDKIKNVTMGKLPWIHQVAWCPHEGPYEREAGVQSQRSRWRKEVKVGVTQPQAEEPRGC